jgi:pterin-4a-carbinolamine dehydratase
MPQITREISLDAADLSHHPTLVKAFGRFTIAIW